MNERVLILTGYDDRMKEVGDLCSATHKEYARCWGFSQETVRQYRPGTHPSWQKIRLIQERIDRYDIMVWLDADTVVTNMATDVRSLVSDRHVMTISVDWCAPVVDDDQFGTMPRTQYVSCGNFAIRHTDQMRMFLDTWERHDRYSKRSICCWEQDGLREAMRRLPWFDAWIYRHPRWIFNAVHPECTNKDFPDGPPHPWELGHFLLHLTNVDRLRILRELQQRGLVPLGQ